SGVPSQGHSTSPKRRWVTRCVSLRTVPPASQGCQRLGLPPTGRDSAVLERPRSPPVPRPTRRSLDGGRWFASDGRGRGDDGLVVTRGARALTPRASGGGGRAGAPARRTALRTTDRRGELTSRAALSASPGRRSPKPLDGSPGKHALGP